LLSLVNDILDVSKFEGGKMELRLEHVDAAMLVKSALTVVKERVQRAEVLVRSRLPPDIGYFNADARKLKQILYNLLSNAIKFTPQGGTIMLEVKSLPDEVHFEVEDTGIGIAPEALDKLFKDFSQIDSSIARQYEGMGLGLALTKRLVELHGGRVWAISELGKGSKFGFSVSRNL
jgi:signal transduction histidine kinase